MSEKEIKKSLPVFPIGTMIMLTDLTARQIRYYEEQGLISPKRSQANRRLYSLNDVDKLLDIKDMIVDGLSIAAIKKQLLEKSNAKNQQKMLTDDDVRRILYQELQYQHELRHVYKKL